MREQFRSNTIRKGEPSSHFKAVHFVADFLGMNWDRVFLSLPSIYAPFGVVFPQAFIDENKLTYRVHQYDLGCTIGNRTPVMIVEIGAIGDDTKHNPGHKQQLINDGIAEKYIQQYFPYCKFYRLNKDEGGSEGYLKKLFFRYGDRYTSTKIESRRKTTNRTR